MALNLETQGQGCTLVGSRYGSLINDDGSAQLAILDSRDTFARLLAFIGSDALVVEYRCSPGDAPDKPQYDQSQTTTNERNDVKGTK